MATQYSNKPIVTDGLVYALDFGNPKSYVSGSSTARSLIYRPTPAKFETLLPGDIAQPAAAYSVRKVVSSYTGDAMMVQSASVSQSIGFDADGNLDTASLASFAGSGDAFVKIWYDQSGNGYDATQSVTTSQPKIYSGSLGSVILENGRPALEFDGVNDELKNDFGSNPQLEKALVIVGRQNEGTDEYAALVDSFDESPLYRIYTGRQATQIRGFHTVDISNGWNTYKEKQLLWYLNSTTAGTVTFYINKILLGTRTTAEGYNGITIGANRNRSGRYYSAGPIQEVLFYTSDQSSNRTNIETSINNYYQIYSPTTNPIPDPDNDFLDFTDESVLRTQQSFPGFSYDQGNSTVMYVGETKGDSTVFTQDGTLSIVSTTSSVGFGSPENLFGRSYPASGLKHITLRFSSGSTDCFINGVPVSASAVLPSGSSFGGGQLNIPVYTGSLGGFQVYNRPLTSDEIYNNYLIAARRYESPELPAVAKPYTLDENAYLFLQSAGITDPIITSSIDTFVRGLKTNNLWDKMIAIYPFVGTGSDGVNLTGSQLWNLKEPSLVTYPLTFTGSWIGTTSGSAPSGSNTNISVNGITPSQYYPFFNTQSAHISILSYDTPASSSYLMGTGMTEELAVSTLAGDYGTPAAAYSVRKVRTAYSGALMDVRRSLDNVTSSIGYVSNGDLDTGSLLDFVRTEGDDYLPGAYDGLAAAYSLRKVSSSYDGPAVDVRRDSDNYVFPVGFTSSGDLDTQTLLQTLTTGSNILPYSNDFTQAVWFLKENMQVTASALSGPFGIGSGSFLNETSATGTRRFAEFLTVSTSSIHNISVFIKKQGRRYITLGSIANGDNNSSTLFDLDTTSSLFSVDNGTGYQTISSSIHYVDNGWFRLSHTFTQGRTDLYPMIYMVSSSDVYSAAPAAYIGEPGTGSYIYGFQYTTGLILQPYVETTGTALYNQPITNPMGYVSTWYDQSGNGNHATQVSASRQPLIVSSGALITENGKPALRFDGTNTQLSGSLTTSGAYTNYVVLKSNTQTGYRGIYTTSQMMMLGNVNISNKWGTFEGGEGGALSQSADTDIRGTYSMLGMISSTGTSGNFYRNGSADGTYVGSSTQQTNGAYIGGVDIPFVNQLIDANIQEIIFYTSDQSANRSFIENNINNYYNIYTGSNHGFVERWYDQSGNNRHAVQSSTSVGAQQIIVESGSILTLNSKPVAKGGYIYGVQNPTTHTDIATFTVGQGSTRTNPNGGGQRAIMWNSLSPTDKYFYFENAGSAAAGNSVNPNYAFINGISKSTTLNRVQIATEVDNQSLITLYWDNINSQINILGYRSNDVNLYDLQEILFYPSDQALNRGAIEYGINDYYNIYPQTSSFTTSSFTIKADSTSISGSLNNKLTSGIQSSGPLGLVTVSRTGSDSLTLARNGAATSFTVPASGALSTGLYLGAINSNGIALGNSPLNLSFASVGTGLTNNEVRTYNRIVLGLNYGLGRVEVNAEYQAVLEYATLQGYTLPSSYQQFLQNKLVSDLKTAGIWDKLDIFYVFATDGDREYAAINWKDPNNFECTEVNSPTFTTNQGFNGDGASSYVDTNYNPTNDGINYVLNDASFGFYIFNLGTSGDFESTYPNDISNTRLRWRNKRVYINSSYTTYTTTTLTSNQFICVNRINSNDINIISDGTSIESITRTSNILSNQNHTTPTNSDSLYSIVFSGGNLTSEASDFYTAVNSYMTSL